MITKARTKKVAIGTASTLGLVLSAEVVIQSLDWRPIEDETNPKILKVSESVGEVRAGGGRCTGSVIAPNVLFTNNHCVSSSGVMATFIVANDVYKCGELLHTNKALDYSLIGCRDINGNPIPLNPLTIDVDPITVGDDISLIHHNCDWASEPFCRPELLHSPGDILEVKATSIKHDADSLGGSSGSPIIRNGMLIGIHNRGMGFGDGTGRGIWNGGIPIRAIIENIPTSLGIQMNIDGDFDLQQNDSEPYVPNRDDRLKPTIIKRCNFWCRLRCLFSRRC